VIFLYPRELLNLHFFIPVPAAFVVRGFYFCFKKTVPHDMNMLGSEKAEFD
jgi:hypothetical protein